MQTNGGANRIDPGPAAGQPADAVLALLHADERRITSRRDPS
jgi:hypothetical protein